MFAKDVDSSCSGFCRALQEFEKVPRQLGIWGFESRHDLLNSGQQKKTATVKGLTSTSRSSRVSRGDNFSKNLTKNPKKKETVTKL